MFPAIDRFLENRGQTLIRWGLIAFALFAPAYLISTGRQSSTEALVGLVLLAVIWKVIGPVGVLSLLAVFIWSSRSAPGLFYRLTGPIWETANLIEVGIYAWLALLLANQVIRKRQGGKFIVPPYSGLLGLFLVGGTVALVAGGAPDKRYAWAMLWRICVAPLALYILVGNYIKDRRNGERVLWGLVLGGLILAAVQLTGWGDVSSTLGYDIQAERLSGSYSFGPLGIVRMGLNTGAVFLGLSAVLAWSIVINVRNRWQRWAGIASVLVLGWVIFQMGTRSVWIAVPVAFLAVVLLSIRRGVARFQWAGLMVVLMVTGAAVAFGLEQLDVELLRRLQTMTTATELLADPTWRVRVDLWRSGLSILGRNPLGTGYIAALPPFYYSTHSEYLALALATGIPGLMALVAFVLLWARRVVFALRFNRDPEADWILPGALGCLVAFAIAAVAADPSKKFYPYMAFWMILSVGMAVAQGSLIRERM
jgi:hypothetical protein